MHLLTQPRLRCSQGGLDRICPLCPEFSGFHRLPQPVDSKTQCGEGDRSSYLSDPAAWPWARRPP